MFLEKQSIIKGTIFSTVFFMLLGFGGCKNESTEPEIPSSTNNSFIVAMYDNYFDPSSLTISVGDTVTWINSSSAAHTSTSGEGCTKDGKWDSGFMTSGQSFKYIFQEAGTYPYYCIPHCALGMKGTINANP